VSSVPIKKDDWYKLCRPHIEQLNPKVDLDPETYVQELLDRAQMLNSDLFMYFCDEGGYMVVLFPRLRHEEPPKFESLPKQCGVLTGTEEWEHTILLPEDGYVQTGDLEFTGPAVVLKRVANGSDLPPRVVPISMLVQRGTQWAAEAGEA